MATEVELKLYCSPDAISRVETHPLITAGVETGPAKHLEGASKNLGTSVIGKIGLS